MSYNKLVEKIIKEQEEPMGLEPLLREFTDISTLTSKEKEEREYKITNYYKAIYDRSKSLQKAYKITKNWANKIFVQPYVRQTLSKFRRE